MKKILSLITGLLFLFQFLHSQTTKNLFISPIGSDNNSGTLDKPFATISKIQEVIRELKKHRNIKGINVLFRKGIYQITKPLIFNKEDGGDSLLRIKYASFKHEKVIISGGKTLSHNWEKTASRNIWKIKIAEAENGKWVFRSLFANDRRLQRTTSDTLLTKSPFPQYAKSFRMYDFASIKRLVKDSIDAFCGFIYSDDDLDSLEDFRGAELILYNSWEASWHSINKIDNGQKAVYFKNPATYPVGFFSDHIRYRIENAKDYFNKPGEWYLDTKAGELYYNAFEGENPNQMQFVVPVIENLLSLKGDEKSGTSVQNLVFSDINFAYTASPWGINDAPESIRRKSNQNFPWIDFKQGYSSGLASPTCGESVLLLNAKDVTFNNCQFYHLGNYAIRIGEYSANNIIMNCKIKDAGGGGIIIGFNKSGGIDEKLPYEISPAYNTITNCIINDCGVVFPSGVGICIMQANHTTVKNNEISNLPYTGISVGWTWGFQDNYTSYNIIENNHIYNVMRILADGGGIYTIGKQVGAEYRGNYIHNIDRSKNAVGSRNNGFFFDEGSSGFYVDSNVVTSVTNDDYRFNKTDSSKLKWGNNYFEKTGKNIKLQNIIRKKFE